MSLENILMTQKILQLILALLHVHYLSVIFWKNYY